MRQHVVDIVRRALARGAAEGRWPALATPFTVDPPRDPRHGDFAVNAAMVLAKPAGRPPRELAQGIIEAIQAEDGGRSIASLEIAGPGFVNLKLRPEVWLAALPEVVRQGAAFGRSEVGKGKRVNVEFVSANPTGPMHVGHGRGAVTGDVVASLLDWSGHAVTREYYVNDHGAQVQTLARSVHLRYQELLGRTVTMPPKSYPGDYVIEIARSILVELGPRFLDAPEAEWLDLFRERAVAHVLAMIRSDLAAIRISFDVWTSERKLYDSGTVQRFLAELEAKDLVYWGKLPPPKSKKGQPVPAAGAPNEEGIGEAEDLLLFRSSLHGDEVDRPVKKSDGTPTYFCADIAYHWDKRQRADQLVDVLGADHGGYVARLEAALEALGASRHDLHVVLIQMVNLTRGGEAVKMSKRSGNVVSLQEVVDEVGCDATRFIFLTRRADAQLDFDIELAKRQTLDNPVFYVQYGHARLARILEKAAEADAPEARFDAETLAVLTAPEEMDLVKRILSFPDLVAGAALAWEPHRVAFWLQETIGAFHSYYTQGKRTGERFIGADPVKTAARLALARSLKRVLANGLAILGVSAPERMESRDLAEDV